jgi:NAD(P)-dependent dehydrogenase (short-subunit alcohol dehydrogenase family)
MTKTVARANKRIVLVTGGSGQLGRYVVRSFLRDGARLHVPTRDAAEGKAFLKFLGKEGKAVHLHQVTDLSNPDTVNTLITRIEEIEGRGPEVVLNLAGGFAMAEIEDTDLATWSKMWGINATTAFLTSRAAFPGMRAAGWGRIINVSALPALDRGKVGLSAYGASKAALLNLTYTLAKEGVGLGITVNAILPSIIDTPANRKSMPNADTATWLPPKEIAEVLLFLASDRARTVNGAAIPLTLG